MSYFTICTEENPQLQEIQFILQYIFPSFTIRVLELRANIVGLRIDSISTGLEYSRIGDWKEPSRELTTERSQCGNWDGSYLVITDALDITVVLRLVKGSGSFVDYIVYDHANPNGETSVPILLLESTKTSDSESRNTAINQRYTKFAVARKRYPSTKCVLYFNKPHNAVTATSLFGRRLLSTLGVEVFDPNGSLLADAPAFTCVEELIAAKNNIKEKKGNVSVKIQEIEPNLYRINAKLSKGQNTTICHDPNKGLITGIAGSIFRMNSAAEFRIADHAVDVNKIPKKLTDKFWYANNRYDLRLEGSDASSLNSAFDNPYWKYETQSEKSATILFQHCCEQKQWHTIYHNHSSSARSHFTDGQNIDRQVPKDITIPDVVLINDERRIIRICEGKIKKDVLMGVNQLNNLTKFIEYTMEYYPTYTIERGLCLYLPNLSEVSAMQAIVTPYPIWFALDSTGNYEYRFDNYQSI
jgi:hypothetical protein